MKEFFTTLQGKVITGLTILALVLGIVAEGISIYRNAMESKTAAETAHNAEKKAAGEGDKAAEDARSAKAAADNAERLRVAEAEERSWLAKKAAADAEAARAAADNAAKLKIAEAEEKTQLAKKAAADAEAAKELAKKAAFDAETAKATAENSARLQDGLAAKAQEDAENLRQKNKILRSFTEGGGTADEMVQRDFNRQLDKLGMGNSPAPRQQEATAANTELSPKCRTLWAKWQGFTHGAFATAGTDDCVMNGTPNPRGTRQGAIESLKKTCAQSGQSCEVIAAK